MKKNPFIARLAILTFTLVASSMPLMAQEESMGIHQALKTNDIKPALPSTNLVLRA